MEMGYKGWLNSRKIPISLSFWGAGSFFICLLVSFPILTVFYLCLGDNQGIWQHLVDTVLLDYISTSLLLMLGVGLGTLLLGVGCAWLVTMYRFPWSRTMEWLLVLPIAMPSYLIAFIYTDLLEYAGPVQAGLRSLFGWSSPMDYWFFEIRSLGGATAMMSLTLYPYVYLLARAAFLEQCLGVLEASRTLGSGPWASFFKIALPLARPSIIIGLSLVLMETMNDFGTVDFFAVKTFTAGIYDVWLNMNSVSGAAQLAVVLLFFILALIALERWARGKRGFMHSSANYSPLPKPQLTRKKGWLSFALCLLPIFFGFLLPAMVLCHYASSHYQATLAADFTAYLKNSLFLSGGAALLCCGVGLFLAYGVRLSPSPAIRMMARFSAMGYAIPGAVLAVGIMIPFGAFDNALQSLTEKRFGISFGLLLSGTVTAMVFAYLVRFLALSYGSAEAGLLKITDSLEGASRTLGMGPLGNLKRLHIPLIRGSLLTAILLVFVDCMKELPMTIILRPFNFETLATFVYQYASDELLEEASLAALAIVASGLIPVVLLTLAIREARPGKRGNI